jgi:hypothetical protein
MPELLDKAEPAQEGRNKLEVNPNQWMSLRGLTLCESSSVKLIDYAEDTMRT